MGTRLSELIATPGRWLARFKSRPVQTPYPHNGLDALRNRLNDANQRVARDQRVISGWDDLMQRERAAHHDLSVSYGLLKVFEADLKVATSQKAEAEKALAQRSLGLFERVRGRLPKNDQELHDWLASPEGKAAMAFEPAA